MKRKISELEVGDLVDLEGDQFADPKHDNFLFECEYQVVAEIETETPDCTVVYFDGGAFGFPPQHIVEVQK